jgi:hypothetical protein
LALERTTGGAVLAAILAGHYNDTGWLEPVVTLGFCRPPSHVLSHCSIAHDSQIGYERPIAHHYGGCCEIPHLSHEAREVGHRPEYAGCYLIVKVRVFDLPPPGSGFLITMAAEPAVAIAALGTYSVIAFSLT